MKLAHFHTSASVNFQIDVLDCRGRVARRLPKRRNLILNSGLDAIGAQTANWRNAITNVAVGTGAMVTKRSTGAVTITANAGALSASAGFFQAGDVGRVLKLDSGEVYIVTGFTSDVLAASTNLTNAAASPGAIHYANRTGLVTETERSSEVAPGGTRTSTWDAALKTMTHTIILLTPTLATSRVYTEIGWSWNASGGGALFGCAPISPSINLGAGQRLRVTISLVVKATPMMAMAVNTGLAVGNCSFELIGSDIGRVHVQSVGLSAASPAIAAPSTSSEPSIFPTIDAGTITWAGYSNGTYKRTVDFRFADSLGAMNGRSLRVSMGDNNAGVICTWRLLLNSVLPKTANDRVDGTFEFSWDRELVN